MSELLLDAAGRRRSPATMPEFHACRPPAQQGNALPRRPADDRGDRRRHAACRRRRPRAPTARPDSRPLARRAAHPRGARARRGRPGRSARLAACPARQGRTAPRGRHGRRGVGKLTPWLTKRVELPVGPLFCVVTGATRGRPWSAGVTAATAFPRIRAEPKEHSWIPRDPGHPVRPRCDARAVRILNECAGVKGGHADRREATGWRTSGGDLQARHRLPRRAPRAARRRARTTRVRAEYPIDTGMRPSADRACAPSGAPARPL